jgi:hypothetical protein
MLHGVRSVGTTKLDPAFTRHHATAPVNEAQEGGVRVSEIA